MYSRMIRIPDGSSAFLFGPRGTGKSSWVRECYPGALYIDLLDSDLYQSLSAQPARLESMLIGNNDPLVILDEIQRITPLLNEVHRLIENRRVRFVLTGSSARKIKRSGANLLAGRARTHFMHPLVAEELDEDFDLKHALRYGMLPTVWVESDAGKYLKSYVTTYLKEEIQQEGLTRNIGAFSRFLEAISSYRGEAASQHFQCLISARHAKK